MDENDAIGGVEATAGENSAADVNDAFGGSFGSGTDPQSVGLAATAATSAAVAMATAANPSAAAIAFAGGSYAFGASIADITQQSIAAGLSTNPDIAAAQLAGLSSFEAAAGFASGGIDYGADGGSSGGFVVAGAWEVMPGVWWSNPYLGH